jgi:hypothetical protein
MKKTLLLALAVSGFIVTAQAQPYKQVGGENNLQLLFAPLSNSPISLNNGIMYRKFNATGTSAWRLGFSVGSSKFTDVLFQASDSVNYPTSVNHGNYTTTTGLNPQADRRNSNFSFSLRPGYEMHCAGTDRLSPYGGAEIVFTKTSTKAATDNITEGNYSVTYYDTNTVSPKVPAPYTLLETNSKGGSTTFGINLIAGFDFYFAKNLSLGAELNFGYYHTSYSDLETEIVKNTTTDPTTTGVFPNVSHSVTSTNTVTSAPNQKQGSSSGFGPNAVAQIKLGWLF